MIYIYEQKIQHSGCCCCRPTPPACSCGGVRQPSFSREALPGVFHLISRGATLSGDNQRSSILLEVYRFVPLNRWSVVCGCVSSTLCRYDIRMGLLLARSWARVRRVSLGRESSEGEILGAC